MSYAVRRPDQPPAGSSYSGPTPAAPDGAATLDIDIVTFCAGRPGLGELAFALADHGHSHVGDVAQLTAYTVRDLARGDAAAVDRLHRRLVEAGLDFSLDTGNWRAPRLDAPDSLFE